MRSGSSSEPIEVAERKDVMEAWGRWDDCALRQMSGVWSFEPGSASWDWFREAVNAFRDLSEGSDAF
jgi:hypothetical protein